MKPIGKSVNVENLADTKVTQNPQKIMMSATHKQEEKKFLRVVELINFSALLTNEQKANSLIVKTEQQVHLIRLLMFDSDDIFMFMAKLEVLSELGSHSK